MPDPRSPPKRDVKLRLALHLQRHCAQQAAKPDPVQHAAERVLYQADHLRRVTGLRRLCQNRGWHKADLTLAARQAAELRDLQYLLSSLDRSTPVAPPAVTEALIYRDLLALDGEFDNFDVADDLSSVSIVTEPITLQGVDLGRFRLTLDLAGLARGRSGGDCLDAEALDPNPAACNDEVTHPHVQGGSVCLGDGSHLLKSALAEGRLYDAFVVVNQVLHTYNDASPFVSLGMWDGRRCDDCDDVVSYDDTYCCEACSNTLCPSCEHQCVDCDASHCRSCLTAKDDVLLCTSCLEDREAKEEAEQEEEDEDVSDEPQSLTPEEAHHEQAISSPG